MKIGFIWSLVKLNKRARKNDFFEFLNGLYKIYKTKKFEEPSYEVGSNDFGAKEIVLGDMNSVEKSLFTFIHNLSLKTIKASEFDLPKLTSKITLTNELLTYSLITRFRIYDDQIVVIVRKGYKVVVYKLPEQYKIVQNDRMIPRKTLEISKSGIC